MVFELFPSVAVTVAACDNVTLLAFAGKFAAVSLASTVTEAGTVIAALLLVRVTTNPLSGACPDNVTEQELDPPETALVGSHCTCAIVNAVSVRLPPCADPK